MNDKKGIAQKIYYTIMTGNSTRDCERLTPLKV
jgi:hypothetical protein